MSFIYGIFQTQDSKKIEILWPILSYGQFTSQVKNNAKRAFLTALYWPEVAAEAGAAVASNSAQFYCTSIFYESKGSARGGGGG